MSVYANRGNRSIKTMKDNPTPSEPRYTYSRVSDKAQPGMPAQKGTDIDEYILPQTDVQQSLRNFPGVEMQQYVNLADLQQQEESGTTETDSVTDKKGSGGYSTINAKIRTKPIKRS